MAIAIQSNVKILHLYYFQSQGNLSNALSSKFAQLHDFAMEQMSGIIANSSKIKRYMVYANLCSRYEYSYVLRSRKADRIGGSVDRGPSQQT